MDETTINGVTIRLVQGDITEQEVDVIVNAANSSLMGGGGVDGAIHRKGGPAILEACKAIRAKQGSLATGYAVSTTAGDLPARWVVHTVGPVWNGGNQGEYVSLEHAWDRSLELASELGAASVAFPSISTGAYRFPIDRAAQVALSTLARFAERAGGTSSVTEVRVVLFSAADLAAYRAELLDFERTKLGR